jgi:cytochrome c biogenesis factor
MYDGLRNYYSVLKDSNAHLKFATFTGVSKLSKANLFSGLNHLGVTITLIGITFSKAERKVSAVDAKQLTDDNSTAIVGWETAQA